MAVYADDFNRANNSSIGANWTEGQGTVTTNTGLAITSNALTCTTPASGARWNTALDSDDHYAQITMGGASDMIYYLAVRAENDGRPAVMMYTSGGSWIIYTVDNAGTTTSRASGTHSQSYSSVLRFTAIGNTYVITMNGTVVGVWIDKDNLHAPSSARRYTTISLQRISGTTTGENWETGDTTTSPLYDPALLADIEIVHQVFAQPSGTRSPSATFTGYVPQTGDVVAFFCHTVSAGVPTLPSGWQAPGLFPSSTSFTQQILARPVSAGEVTGGTTTYTATNLSSTSITWYLCAVILRGVDTANIFAGGGGLAQSSGSSVWANFSHNFTNPAATFGNPISGMKCLALGYLGFHNTDPLVGGVPGWITYASTTTGTTRGFFKRTLPMNYGDNEPQITSAFSRATNGGFTGASCAFRPATLGVPKTAPAGYFRVDRNISGTFDTPDAADTSGVWVTARGAGGGGGYGAWNTSTDIGGSGGGSGGVVERTFVPIASMGPTFTVIPGAAGWRGLAGASGAAGGNGRDGGDSQFLSGSVSLVGEGGGGGGGGGTSAAGAAGAAGSTSVSGVTPSGTINGTAGGISVDASTGTAGGTQSNANGAAGGGGGGAASTDRAGGAGGAVTGLASGGAGGATGSGQAGNGSAWAEDTGGSGGGGGAGRGSTGLVQHAGTGLGYGAGGGGGGGQSLSTAGSAAYVYPAGGGPGQILLEWAEPSTPEATASGSYNFAGSAVGDTPPNKAASSGAYAWAGTAVGYRLPKATTSGLYSWAATAVGKRTQNATAAGSYTWSSSATGVKVPKAISGGSYNFEGLSDGYAIYEGETVGSYTWAGTASGQTPSVDVTATGYYNWAATAIGKRVQKATAAGDFGWAATVVGKRNMRAAVPSASYAFAGNAVGKKVQRASASGSYNFAGSATGLRTGAGIASGSYHFSSLATGLFVPKPQPGAVGWWLED